MFDRIFPFFQSPQFDAFEDMLQTFVVHQALIAPFILLFIEESGIPLPVPGDVYLAFTGYEVSKGVIPYWVAFFLLLLAVMAGSSILYFISAQWGKLLVDKIGMYFHVDQKKLERVEREFNKYGIFVIIFGRHIPGFRIPITVFSGISGVPYRTFIIGTFISVIFWIGLYLSIGARVGKNVLRHLHTTPAYFLIICIPFVFFIVSIIYIKLKNNKKKSLSDKINLKKNTL